ncbi:MAG: NRDE family protein [Pseudomonadales bacterium]|nr:NRDE family protein [Pseudomonadales bacterium]
MQKSTPLVVAANRDEFYTRPTHPAHYWDKYPELLAGKDLEAGGTWLGVTKTGKFAAVTNLTDAPQTRNEISRGELVLNFLTGNLNAQTYAESLQRDLYKGFNLLIYDGKALFYTSNGMQADRQGGPLHELAPGYYGLSNSTLDSEWPKVQEGKQRLKQLIETQSLSQLGSTHQRHKELVAIMQPELPTPGSHVDAGTVYRTGSCFIRGQEYGTRASTSLLIEDSSTSFYEQNYKAGGLHSDNNLFELKQYGQD